MALKLKQNNQILEVLGELNAQNSTTLKAHFEQFLKNMDELILNLDNVTLMEPSSAFSVEQLYLDFVKRNKIIHIIGKENKHISHVMKLTRTSYILSDDRH